MAPELTPRRPAVSLQLCIAALVTVAGLAEAAEAQDDRRVAVSLA